MSNDVPIHNKGDKQLLQNYRLVFLLPICSKIFERIIFNPIFEFLDENGLLCPNQSGFRPFDSCENLFRARDTKGARGPCPPTSTPLHTHTHTHTFLYSKKKKGKQGKKERFSKQKLLKSCHQGQNVTVLAILESRVSRIQKIFLSATHGSQQYFSVFHGPSTLKSISPALLLLSIVHDIYANFDQHPTLELRANFFDISKAFNKVWHEGLLFKLERTGISRDLPSLIRSFLSNRFQQVVLNDQCSSWTSVLAGVPQGSILGPLLFLIYINDLPDNLQATARLFTDDISFFSTAYNPNISASQVDSDPKKISHWAYEWKLTFNPDLSKQAQEVIFSRKTVKISHRSLTFNTVPVARTTCQKHLGLYLDEKLSFFNHINAKI